MEVIAMLQLYGDVLESEADIICHQVNCCGVMKAGLAKQIAEKYPVVKKEYMDLTHPCSLPPSADYKHMLLGTIQTVKVNDNQYICNIFGQLYYGRQSIVYTDYSAFDSALNSLGNFCVNLQKETGKSKITVAFPYGIGCGLANGSWKAISASLMLFEARFKNVIDIEIWKQEDNK